MNRDVARRAFHALPLRTQYHIRIVRDVRLVPIEPEMRLLPHVVTRARVSVDVGANLGLYSYVLSRFSDRVLSLEPNPVLSTWLLAVLPQNCEFIGAALSDRAGRDYLRVPRYGQLDVDAHGTLAPANRLEEADAVATLPVDTITLCDLLRRRGISPNSVDFMKVDVEGHEAAVLKGAREILQAALPTLLVECEHRHGADVVSVFDTLSSYGYLAYVARDGKRFTRTAAEDLRVMQSPERLEETRKQKGRGRTYLNNVLFMHPCRGEP